MALMKTSSFNTDQQAWLSQLDQKVLSSWVNLKSKPIDLPSHFLPRPELSKKLSENQAITWLLAPAGYGKSVLLSDWYQQTLAKSDSLGIWLTLDSKDNHPAFLLRHLLEAANKVIPGIATDALAHWLSTTTQGAIASDEVLLLLLDEIQDLNCPVILVLDNLHHIEDLAAWQVIQSLVTQLPNNLRLRLSSRYLPVALGKLRLDPRLKFIKQSSLAFNLQETCEWLKNAGVEDQQQALNLMQRMQGWPTGLGLWLVSQQDKEHWPENLAPEREELADYLIGEVLNTLDEPLKDFLIKISVLNNFNETLCNQVLGIEDSAQWIQQLIHHNIFIESIDQRSGWFSLHPMLSELLRQFTTEQQRRKTHLAAFNCLKQQGFRVEALQHARLGQLISEAVQWVEEEVDLIIADLDFAAVLAWCDFAGDQIVSNSPRLQLVKIWSLLLTFQYQAAINAFNQLDTVSVEQLYPGQLLAIKGYLARGEGDDAQARSLCELALRELPSDRFAVRVLMCSTLTNLELVSKQPEAARIWNRLEIDIARQYQATGLEVLALFDYARVELYRGHIGRSAEVVEQGLVLAQALPQQNRLFPRARLVLYRAFMSYLQGDNEAAKQDVFKGIDEANQCRDVTVLYGYSLLTLMHIANSEFHQALDVLAQAERLMQRWQVSPKVYQSWVAIVKANIWMSMGKWARAEQSLKFAVEVNSELFPMQSGLYRLTQARLNIQQQNFEPALSLIDSVVQHGQAGIIQLVAMLLKAATYKSMEDGIQAQKAWEQGLEFAQQENIKLEFNQILPSIRSFSDKALVIEEKLAAPLLTEASNLSVREKEVLSLIADGFSNQDVADRLFISLHTVKTHARKINAKLGAKSRTQAIVKARELAII